MRPSTSSMSSPQLPFSRGGTSPSELALTFSGAKRPGCFYQPPGVPLVPGSGEQKRFLGARPISSRNGRRPHISPSTPPTSTILTEGFLKAAGAQRPSTSGRLGPQTNSEGPRSCPCRQGSGL